MSNTATKLRSYFGATWLEGARLRATAKVGGGPILLIALVLVLLGKIHVWAIAPLAVPAFAVFWLSLAVGIGFNNRLALHKEATRPGKPGVVGIIFADLIFAIILFVLTAWLTAVLGQIIGDSSGIFAERARAGGQVLFNFHGSPLAWFGFALVVLIGVLPAFLHALYMVVVLFTGNGAKN